MEKLRGSVNMIDKCTLAILGYSASPELLNLKRRLFGLHVNQGLLLGATDAKLPDLSGVRLHQPSQD
jgi:hypothetical protein